MPIKSRRIEAALAPLLFGAVLLAAWHVAAVSTGTRVLPGPAKVAQALRELAERGLLLTYTLDSLRRVAGGYAIALVLGVPLGLWMGLSRPVNAALNPLVQLLRPISPIAWIPVAIVLFGVGEGAPIFLISLAAFFPICAATAAAVRDVPPVLLAAGRNFGLGQAALLRRVVLPAAFPHLLVSLRITFGVSWLVVVAAEMIAVDSGLGYLIIDARNAGKRYDLVVAGMVTIGLVGLLLDLSFRLIERRHQ